jgi:hypothetical protein
MYVLQDSLRARLKLPLGTLVPNEERTKSNLSRLVTYPLVLVGDVTASVMTSMGFEPSLILLDNHTKRGKEIPTLTVKPGKVVKVDNEPGIVGPELLKALDESMRPIVLEEDMGGPIIIDVNGEEDLATLPCIKMLPEGGTVVYGQPDKGLVVVNVSKEIKEKVEEMLREMEV